MSDGFQLQIDDDDDGSEETGPQPKTLKEAVEVLLQELPPETLAEVRELKSKDMWELHFGLGMWIRNRMLWGNSELCEAVLNKPGDWLITPGSPDEAWEPIVKALRRRLRADQKAALALAEKRNMERFWVIDPILSKEPYVPKKSVVKKSVGKK